MEPRKVTIINSKTQSQTVITNSTATTLGELKAELDMQNIDYSDMSFFEGHMRAELIDDSSVLPEEIPYKGGVVRDLVFMLTATNKKIKSGMYLKGLTRAGLYELIRENSLQEECKKRFGKNFTQCSTANLIQLLEDDTSKKAEGSVVETPVEDVEDKVKEAIRNISNFYIKLLQENVPSVEEVLNKNIKTVSHKTCDNDLMSEEELDEMFDFIQSL